MTGPVLEVVGLCRSFGGLVVADDISLALVPGERTALIGPNGAGKTTFVNLVSGALKQSAGDIVLAGEAVTHRSEIERSARGLIRSFQISRLFPEMSPRDHLVLTVLLRERRGGNMWRRPASIGTAAEESAQLLGELGLGGVADTPVREIAYGQQRLVEIAIALAMRPKVLFLDEPAAGVPHGEADLILDALERLPAELAVLLIEHDMSFVFRFAQRVVVLANGAIIFDGAPEAVEQDARVRASYLGSYAHGRDVA